MYVYLIASCSMMFVCLCMCFKRVRFLFFIVGLLVFLILLYLWCCFFYSVVVVRYCLFLFFFFKQKSAYECRISDWSSDVCSSDRVRGCLPGMGIACRRGTPGAIRSERRRPLFRGRQDDPETRQCAPPRPDQQCPEQAGRRGRKARGICFLAIASDS